MVEPDGDRLVEWLLWLDERPEAVRRIAAKYPPWYSYRKKGMLPDESYRIVSYEENDDGSISLFMYVDSPTFPRNVFGVKPEELERVLG